MMMMVVIIIFSLLLMVLISDISFQYIAFAILYHIIAGYMLKYRLCNEFFSELIVQLKIIIATFQIISSSSNTLLVNYPHLFQSFTEIMQV